MTQITQTESCKLLPQERKICYVTKFNPKIFDLDNRVELEEEMELDTTILSLDTNKLKLKGFIMNGINCDFIFRCIQIKI